MISSEHTVHLQTNRLQMHRTYSLDIGNATPLHVRTLPLKWPPDQYFQALSRCSPSNLITSKTKKSD